MGHNSAFVERAFQVLGLYIGSFRTGDVVGGQSPLKTLFLSAYSDPTSLRLLFKKHRGDVLGERLSPERNTTDVCTAGSPNDHKVQGAYPRSPSPLTRDQITITSTLVGIRTIRVGISKYQEFMVDLFRFVNGFPDVGVLEIVGLPLSGLKRLRRTYGGMIIGDSSWVVRDSKLAALGTVKEGIDFLD